MKGLIIWAQSSCRSVMAFYRELGKAFNVPIVVALWYYKSHEGEISNRAAIGFEDSEFSDMDMVPIGEDFDKGMLLLSSHAGWHHLCCNYQGSPNFRRLLLIAASRGDKVAVGSESPCNMQRGIKGLLRDIYFRTKLPFDLRKIIAASEFMINYSGNDCRLARLVGWPSRKIIPFGYFPPPIPLTSMRERKTNNPFEILSTGELTWHRGSDILIDALLILKRIGVKYHATVTQQGPLLNDLKAKTLRYNLPVDFPGMLEMKDLRRAYESCSVFVGAGRREPWGMRLNDALNCGAPLVVSRGMGGVKMVDDCGCGMAFENEDPEDLARKLEILSKDGSVYAECAKKAVFASKANSAATKAKELVKTIEREYPLWLK